MPVKAQSMFDENLSSDFAMQVKSVSEFIKRFNSVEGSSDSAIAKKLALCDFQMSHGDMTDDEFRTLLSSFARQSAGTQLNLTDSQSFAVLTVKLKAFGKTAHLNLALRQQFLREETTTSVNTPYSHDEKRWALVGATGLKESELAHSPMFRISPVEHEIHFMTLGEQLILNPDKALGARGRDIELDDLSVFLAWAYAGVIEEIQVEHIEVHFLQVPGYAFVINEIPRRGANSGWLINKIQPIENTEKYIKNITGR